jgi:hypothetical protein
MWSRSGRRKGGIRGRSRGERKETDKSGAEKDMRASSQHHLGCDELQAHGLALLLMHEQSIHLGVVNRQGLIFEFGLYV